MPLARANPTSIEKRNPTSIELGGGVLPPPTEVPVKPTYMVTALPVAIRIDIDSTSGSNRATGHRVRIRRRNDDDTAWQPVQAWIDIGRARSYIYTNYSTTQAIEAGRRYEVKVIAYNIIGDSPEGDYVEVVPLTNIPAVPTFALEAHDTAIRVTINKVVDPLGGDAFYEWDADARNAADTDWSSLQGTFIRAGDSPGLSRIVRETDTQIVIDIINLINGQRLRIRVRSANADIKSDWSAYMEATPMAGVMPAQLPGLPTFTFAPLRYEYDATGDEVSATVNFNPRPNADGVGVTHWLFRYRERGTTDWQTQTVVAQPELDTVYGFRLDEDDIGNTYELQVASRNAAGDSAYTSSQTILVAQPLVPAPVFTITYNPFAINDALYFTCDPTAPVSPVLPLVGYDIRYREVGTSAWATVGHSLDLLNIGYFVELTDRFIGKLLEVQMRGVNEYSGGVWSSSQRLQIIGVPNRPDLFLTAQSGGFDARIVPPPSGYRSTAQHIRYREQGTTDWTTTETLTVRGLDGLTTYEVQVWTSNPAGESLRTTRTVTTLALPMRSGKAFMFGGDTIQVPAQLTGGFERVGSATEFGVGESFPEGLTFIGNTLYMVGDALYTLDQTTGIATRVGSATAFGVSENRANGIASIGNTLYMVGTSTNVLYILDKTTGVATRVGSATAFGVNEHNPRGLAFIGNTLYMVGSSNFALYTLDVTTGVATRVGSAIQFGINRGFLIGITSIGNTLYAVDNGNLALYTLDVTTGVATRVGSVLQFGVSESDPRGLAAIGNTLYMVGAGNDVLYRSLMSDPRTVQKPPQHFIVGGKSFSIGV